MQFPNSWLRLITFCFITGLFLRHSAQNISHIGEQTRQNKLFPSSSSDKIPTIIDKAMEQKQNDRKRVPNSDLALRRKIYIPTETKFVSPLYDTEYLANSHSRAKRQIGFGGLGGLGGLGGFGGLGGGFGGCCPLMGPIPPMCCPMAMGIFAPCCMHMPPMLPPLLPHAMPLIPPMLPMPMPAMGFGMGMSTCCSCCMPMCLPMCRCGGCCGGGGMLGGFGGFGGCGGGFPFKNRAMKAVAKEKAAKSAAASLVALKASKH